MNLSSSISFKERSAMFNKIHVLLIGFLLAAIAYLQPYRLVVVVGDSMLPTYHSGQILLAKRSLKIEKNDVVVVKSEALGILIKRVAYGPGEYYYYLMNSDNKAPLLIKDNSYQNINKYYNMFSKKNILELKVPLNYYYILGDNADNSEDSRSFGSIEQSEIQFKIVN
jgi:signal peptidase I